MSRKSIYLVVFLAVISLIGIIATQVFWVNKAFNIQEREFNDRAVIALTSVVERIQILNGDSADVIDPVTQESSNYFVANVNDTLHPYLLENLLKQEFSSSQIKQDFEYVIYDCFTDSIVFGSRVNISSPDNKVEAESVTPQKKLNQDGHFFGVYFPKKGGYILDQMGIWVFSSFMILLVVSFFAYSILAILKQKRLSEIKTDFINNMTHELKTPISTISLSSDAILKNTENEQIQKFASIIKNENSRLKNQVNRVLDIATLTPNKLKLKKESIQLNALLKEITESFNLRIEEKQGKLTLDFTDEQIEVLADKFHLTNVFNNLLDNALKYCNAKPNIKVKVERSNNQAKISITDNGIGIEKKHQKMIFEKFFRVPTGNLHEVKGFGLGLFYVKSVIEDLGGSIELKESSKNGSRFELKMKTIDNG